MSIVKIDHACHTAYLDPMSGQGLLLLPAPEDDVSSLEGFGADLHHADYDAVTRDLDVRGWEMQEDDETGMPWTHVGYAADGRQAVALYGLDPITSTPNLEQLAASMGELLEAAGVRAEYV